MAGGPVEVSVAVTVQLPAVLKVTVKVRVPPERELLAGRTALVSLELIAIVWILAARFPLVSTALTVIEQATALQTDTNITTANKETITNVNSIADFDMISHSNKI